MSMRTYLLLGSLIVFYSASLCSGALPAERLRCPSPMTRMVMEKGEYSPLPGAVFNLKNFAANLVARGPNSPLCFTRTVEVQHGEVLISGESLTTLFAQKVKQSSSSVKEVKIELAGDAVHLSGKIHKGIDIPFEVEGPVSTDGTVLIIQAKKINAKGIAMKGLLGMLGVHLGSMMGSGSVSGVTAKGDNLIFEPIKIAHVRGKITSAQLTAKALIVTFGGEMVKQQQH